MSKVLAIIGAGDLGMQIAHYAISDNHYDKVVFFDDFARQNIINGYPILGSSDDIIQSFQEKGFDQVIIGIGYKHLNVRKELFEKLYGKVPFGKIIHSSSWVDRTVQIHRGTVIYPNCTIDAGAVIDNNTILNLNCTIAHDTHIGRHCFLSPRVAIAGFVKIKEQCIIGINATLIDNITIPAKTRIGGGTVVIDDLEKNGLYVGNPHRLIR